MFPIKQIFLIAACYFYSIFRGAANKQNKEYKKILIIQLAKLGDMVCTTPMFRAVKFFYPNSKLYVMGNKINEELVGGNPDLDKYIVFNGKILQSIFFLRKENIDFACITGPSFILTAILYLAGIPLISVPRILNGFSPYETKSFKIIRKLCILIDHKMGYYAPGEYLRLLEPINIFYNNIKKYLYFSKKADEKIKKYFIDNNVFDNDFIVGISPSVGNKIKEWPTEKFSKLVNYIFNKYKAKIIIIGGERDRKEVVDMISGLDKNIKIINALALFNLDELKCLISKMSIFISVDTGPIYIAEAFNVPTIDIIGPMDEKEQPPIGNLNRVVFLKNRQQPQLHIMNARIYDKLEARRQIDEITPNMVIENFEQLVNIIKK